MTDLYYDPYDVAINADPYPTFARLREEAPLYYNDQHDFFAVSRFDDVERGLKDRDTFISGRGGILELIKSGMEIPPGTVIFEDPPAHTIHRSLLSRMFTPRKVAALEGRVALDELLTRFPEWDVDLCGAHIASTSTVRGCETLPVVVA